MVCVATFQKAPKDEPERRSRAKEGKINSGRMDSSSGRWKIPHPVVNRAPGFWQTCANFSIADLTTWGALTVVSVPFGLAIGELGVELVNFSVFVVFFS